MEDCRPCPDHGTCSNGELFCDQGYVEFSGKCVKDKKLSLLTRDIRNKLEKILRERAGSCICGSTPNVQREMDRTQLYKETLSLFGDKVSGIILLGITLIYAYIYSYHLMKVAFILHSQRPLILS
jgi:hypothetical protein